MAAQPEQRPRPVAGPARTLRSCHLLRAAPGRRADLPPVALALPQQQALCSQNPLLQQRNSCPVRGGWQPPHGQSHLLRAAPRRMAAWLSSRAVPQARPPGSVEDRRLPGTHRQMIFDLEDLPAQTTHSKLTGLSSCPRAVVQNGSCHLVYIRSGAKAARSVAYVNAALRKNKSRLALFQARAWGRARGDRGDAVSSSQPGRVARRA